ncbi:sphingolipid transporter [Martiniozyma asiatica (nom. inval.)]|nr:sphingolipid transporter [Martiniozyma asiatica]
MEEPQAVHESGRCAIYGSGGSVSFFGPSLPKPGNVPAVKLSAEQSDALVAICGDSWRFVDYACCDSDQMDTLKSNLEKVDALIASCPACKENFYQLFCHFSCSPDQSGFVNVTDTQKAFNDEEVVSELQFYIDGVEFADPFFESCKNIKFGATNGFAMDLIGGGASNYKEFLKFLGDKKPEIGGSPFQINFVYETSEEDPSLQLFETSPKYCNDQDPKFRCSCSDCPEICPTLEPLPSIETCMIGPVSCVSAYIAIAYIVSMLGYIGYYFYQNYMERHNTVTAFLADDSDNFLENTTDHIGEDTYQYQINGSVNNESLVNSFLKKWFYNLGYFCANNAKFVILLSIFVSVMLSSSMQFLQLETNPINLWVSPKADAFIQKQMFDESFGPFYRTQQLIISNKYGSILQDYEIIEWWFEKEQEILNLSYDNGSSNITYQDLCFKPLGDTCILESFTQYFNGDISKLDEVKWRDQIDHCATSPVECLPDFQQPLKKSLIFGGDIDDSVLDSSAIVVTLLNNNENYKESIQVQNSIGWETVLENYILTQLIPEAEIRKLNVGFNTEMSLEKELNKSTNTDAKIVLISYLVMLTYASLALGGGKIEVNGVKKYSISFGGIKNACSNILSQFDHYTSILKLLTHTRFSLGFIGILIVLTSVSSAVGFWSFFGLKSTLIIAEVIPFLILAVGVDNIFLICNAITNVENSQDLNLDLNIPEKIGRTMMSCGPSIALSCTCQFFCFLLGSIVAMPAVRNFALYSAMAVIFNTILQCTLFLSVLSFDMYRIECKRLDVIPFVKIETQTNTHNINSNDREQDEEIETSIELTQLMNESKYNESYLLNFFQYFSNLLFLKRVEKFILLITITIIGISLSSLPNIKLGLDQRIALPSDSYLINYFNDIYDYLNVGPPIYFIAEDLEVTERANQQLLCSKFTTCDEFSLVNVLIQEATRSEQSTVAEPPASWIDDFLMWLNPSLSDCCVIRKRPLHEGDKEFCPPFSSPRLCESCFENRDWEFDMSGFPVDDEFLTFMLAWLDQDSYPCPLGGKAPYTTSIDFNYNNSDEGSYILGVKRSAFRTSHTPLRSQEDFINAYENSLRIINNLKEKHPELNIWAYSPFYIFFVQYVTLIPLTFSLIGFGLIMIFVLGYLFLGSWRNSMVLIAYLLFVLILIGGWMSLVGIGLNAVSLVNLLICLGLGVEFGIHIVRYFNFTSVADKGISLSIDSVNDDFGEDEAMRCNVDKNEQLLLLAKSKDTLVNIGPATLSGITMTKILGIIVLSFTQSQIFRVYYFKMWVGLIASASLGALILLPILLGRYGEK